MTDFYDYHRHTEALIDYLAERLDEDDVYADACWFPRLYRALSITQQRADIADYRQAVARAGASTGAMRHLWRQVARCHGFCLRRAAMPYAGRPGFDRAWLRAI